MISWAKVEQLQNQTLEMLTHRKRFTIVEVSNGNVYFVPDNGAGTRRWVTRAMLEHIAAQDWAATDLRPKRIAGEYPSDRNSSYMAAILNAVMKPRVRA